VQMFATLLLVTNFRRRYNEQECNSNVDYKWPQNKGTSLKLQVEQR